MAGGNFTVTLTNSASRSFFRLCSSNATTASSGMALIPAGEYTIGDTEDGEFDAIPTNVYVSGFYMDVNLVTYSQWVNVYSWATNHGYSFDYNYFVNAFFYYKGPNFPANSMNWYDAVKWCNARSQMAGLTPAYYTDEEMTQVYDNGDETNMIYVDWATRGYRLPTEAEWEKAARGGLSGLRFPWGNLISETNANYEGSNSIPYDLGPNGYNPAGTNTTTGIYTTLVGTFAPNGYGLYDMAGNLAEFCWDWYDPPPYPAGSAYLGGTDPRGPASSDVGYRCVRSGGYDNNAVALRCASRGNVNFSPNFNVGFRCVSTE
jgi:formylglycine-generating enzyme required for sulfatase activity